MLRLHLKTELNIDPLLRVSILLLKYTISSKLFITNMKIYVKVKMGGEESIKFLGEGRYVAVIKEPRKKGKANEKLIKNLAKYFRISRSQLLIIRGEYTSNKEILLRE